MSAARCFFLGWTQLVVLLSRRSIHSSSPSSGFRASARPGSASGLGVVKLVQNHDTIVFVDCVLGKHFALLARTDCSLLLLSLSFLVQPLLTNSVLGRVL